MRFLAEVCGGLRRGVQWATSALLGVALREIITGVFLVLSLETQAQTPHTTTPNVTVLTESFTIPQLGRERRVWLYLPNDYATSQRRYPVLYLQDGQNVFDEATSYAGEWGVDETLSQLQQSGQDYGCIVVAVDNDGKRRLDEYSPWRNEKLGGGEGDAYAEFLVKTLKPYLDTHYRTLPGREHTGIAGSSMGALISLYTALKYQDVFSKVGLFSPAFWFAQQPLFAFVRGTKIRQTTRFYFVAGAQEGPTMVPLMAAMRDSLRQVGVEPKDISYQVSPDGKHSEWFWRREFPAAYQWLYAPKRHWWQPHRSEQTQK
jgi:predicted alpha/beta superfamily hydrolase